MSSPFDEGKAAFYKDKMPDDNPYKNEDSDHKDEWEDGYNYADQLESGDNN